MSEAQLGDDSKSQSELPYALEEHLSADPSARDAGALSADILAFRQHVSQETHTKKPWQHNEKTLTLTQDSVLLHLKPSFHSCF